MMNIFKKKYLFLISSLFNVNNSMQKESKCENTSLLFCPYEKSSVNQGVIYFCFDNFKPKDDMSEYFNTLVDTLSKEDNIMIFILNNNILEKYPDITKILNNLQKPWILLNSKEINPLFGKSENILEIKSTSPHYINKITDKKYDFSQKYLENIKNYVTNNFKGLSDEMQKNINSFIRYSILYIISQDNNKLNEGIIYSIKLNQFNGKKVFLQNFKMSVEGSIYTIKDKEIISISNEISHIQNENIKFNIYFITES